MVMAPGGNLGGDIPFIPQQGNAVGLVQRSTSLAVTPAGSLLTVLSSPTLPAGLYDVRAMINLTAVTAADQIIARIISSIANLALSTTSIVQGTSGLAIPIYGFLRVAQSDTIKLQIESATTTNATVQGIDNGVGLFTVTWLGWRQL